MGRPIKYYFKQHWQILFLALLLWCGTALSLLSANDQDRPENSEFSVTKLRFAKTGNDEPDVDRSIFASPPSPDLIGNPDGLSEIGDVQPALPPAPALLGVISSRKKSIAILRGTDGSAQNLQSGDIIDGWLISAISAESVTISASGTSQKILMEYGPVAPDGTVTPLTEN